MGQLPKIIETGVVANDHPVSSFGEFPFSYLYAARNIATQLYELCCDTNPDIIVIEEINKPGRFGNRYAQKVLDFIHCLLLADLEVLLHNTEATIKVVYVNTSDWRRIVGANLTKADKALNVKVRKLKKAGDKEALKKLGVRGRIGKKHVAVRYVNQTFGLNLKMKDNDIADALCQGVAYLLGVKHCDGK
jgi:hypothetical protein